MTDLTMAESKVLKTIANASERQALALNTIATAIQEQNNLLSEQNNLLSKLCAHLFSIDEKLDSVRGQVHGSYNRYIRTHNTGR